MYVHMHIITYIYIHILKERAVPDPNSYLPKALPIDKTDHTNPEAPKAEPRSLKSDKY